MLSPLTSSSNGGVLVEYLVEGAEVANCLGLRVIYLCVVALLAKKKKFVFRTRKLCALRIENASNSSDFAMKEKHPIQNFTVTTF